MMKSCIKISVICLLMSLQVELSAQSMWATEVIDFSFGTSQIFGQDSAYFPANVLGPVSELVSPTTPAGTPEEVVSLGKGGYITLGFEFPIVNGPGPDFTVFENAFAFPGGVFDEWMIVSVSADGIEWNTFPFDTLTGAGMAGRTPTTAFGVNYADPLESGGDSFDLDSVGADTIRYVRLEDATQYQGPDRLSADLDAVIGIHSTAPTSRTPSLPAGLQASLSGNTWTFQAIRPTQLRLISMSGQVIDEHQLYAGIEHQVRVASLPSGPYVWAMRDRQGHYAYKWIQ